jgi:hypothetical protein
VLHPKQNAQQRALATRFETLARAAEPAARVHARQLELKAEDGMAENFGKDTWFVALAQKTRYWAELAAQQPP